MQHELVNNLGKPFFRWEYDEANNWLYLNWIGYISEANGKSASRQILKLQEQKHYQYLLNDNREVLGPWGGGKKGNIWLQKYLFPKAVEHGLQYFAHVLSPGIASALLAQDLHQRLSGLLNIQLFGDINKARAWLQEMQQQPQLRA